MVNCENKCFRPSRIVECIKKRRRLSDVLRRSANCLFRCTRICKYKPSISRDFCRSTVFHIFVYIYAGNVKTS